MTLEIKDLSVKFSDFVAIKNISFSLKKGEVLGIVGESGSGKTLTALSILKLLPDSANISASSKIIYEKENILQLPNMLLQQIRGGKIGMVFQEPMSSLNPLHSIKKQISEAIRLHQKLDNKKLEERINELIDIVELDVIKNRLDVLPHKLSGGQRQRLMIAMALANNPEVLIADEPTTALDVTVQKQIMELLKKLQKKLGLSVLLITHNLNLIKKYADRALVMQEGEIVEEGIINQIFAKPKHVYTKKLINSNLDFLPKELPKKREEILKIKDLNVQYDLATNFVQYCKNGFKKNYFAALKNANLGLSKKQTIGIIGESGSGKTTYAFSILKLLKAKGEVYFNNENILELSEKKFRQFRKDIQIVFQDPFSSLNPRMSVTQILQEGLKAHNICKNRDEREEQVDRILEDVGLKKEVKNRYPHEFSGGQRQRISIARALILQPKCIIFDEPTSALDVSTQYEIIKLLLGLQQKKNLSYIFISHDLSVIKSVSHYVVVLKNGEIVEQGDANDILSNPKTDYTKSLLDASCVI